MDLSGVRRDKGFIRSYLIPYDAKNIEHLAAVLLRKNLCPLGGAGGNFNLTCHLPSRMVAERALADFCWRFISPFYHE